MKKSLLHRALNKLQHLWLQPIDVFVFHKVEDVYNPAYGGIGDWTETSIFKSHLLRLRQDYEFITLEDAYRRLTEDMFRFRKYAVLTSDDGYQSLLGILPWLEEQCIPVTLFLSVQYLDGVSHDSWFDTHWRDKSPEEINALVEKMYLHTEHLLFLCGDNVTIGIHGYGHDEVDRMSKAEFEAYLDKCIAGLNGHSRFVPFYAYTWGRHSTATDQILREKSIVPVYCDNQHNTKFNGAIHRICIDGQA